MTDHKNKLRIRLLRHGLGTTGGDIYEKFIAEKLSFSLQKLGFSCFYEDIISKKIYNGINNFKLLNWGFKKANADINIVVARLAVASLLRNLFNKKLTIIVLHNFDERDGKSSFLANYFKLLFTILKTQQPGKAAILTVSPFFRDFFKSKFSHLQVFMVPNLFDSSIYEPYKKCLKNNRSVFLGQFSAKNDEAVFRLAKKLSAAGYKCFFFTLYPHEVTQFPDYEVIYVSFEKYLKRMAEAVCTISFTGINEGWNRVTHESILVGTPVIGFKRGGLGNLLEESNSYIINSADEAFDLIQNENLEIRAPKEFYTRYSIEKAGEYLKPLTDFCKHAASA